MLLASMDLWDIVNKYEEPLPSNVDPKVLKEYERHIKKAMFIIGLNLVDNQFVHINNCKGPAETWKIICNISNILFIHPKIFTCKMQKNNNLLDHVNKIKMLANQLANLEVSMRTENIVMILLESLLTSFKYLITAVKTMPMKELTMDYVTAHLMHKMLKRKENEPQSEDAAMMLCQIKGNNSFSHQGAKSCFHCNKPDHIVCFCYKLKNKE